MPYPKIDATRLKVWPLTERRSYIDIRQEAADPLAAPPALPAAVKPQVRLLADRVRAARKNGAGIMLTYGAHLIKNGGSTLLRWLVENGFVTHLATQGAGTIHDWEFAYQGVSSESVRDNAPVGRFGAWDETGKWMSLAVLAGAAEGLGMGESLGKLVADEGLTLPTPETLRQQIAADPAHDLTAARADLFRAMQQFSLPSAPLQVKHPFKQYSILACAYERRVPLTVHPGIGYDIIVNHPMFPGGAIGRASATDARIFAHAVGTLAAGGVYLSVGSAIMSPQVFEKAFSAANNLRGQQRQPFLHDHYITIVDIQDGGGWDWKRGEPPKENPAYYLRYCKSFYRMGGTLDYIQSDNRAVLANLIHELRQ
jgi:hypothetical protein